MAESLAVIEDLRSLILDTKYSENERQKLLYYTSKVDHIVAFTAIFSDICTVHVHGWGTQR